MYIYIYIYTFPFCWGGGERVGRGRFQSWNKKASRMSELPKCCRLWSQRWTDTNAILRCSHYSASDADAYASAGTWPHLFIWLIPCMLYLCYLLFMLALGIFIVFAAAGPWPSTAGTGPRSRAKRAPDPGTSADFLASPYVRASHVGGCLGISIVHLHVETGVVVWMF